MIKFIYTEDEKELLEIVGIKRDLFWEYLSLDDWDYALIFDGHIPPNKMPENVKESLLQGCYDNTWQYIPSANKTVGMAYHS